MKKYKDLFIGLLTFLLYFLYAPIIKYIFELFKIDIKSLNNVLLNIILIAIDLSLVAIIFIIFRKELITDFKNFTSNKGKWFFKYLGIFVGSVLIMGLFNFIISKITNIDTSENEKLVREYIKILPVYMTVSTVIYAPFVEEILFRKCIRKIIKGNDKYIQAAYVLVSAIVFGLIHVLTLDASFYEILMGIPYMVVGLSLAYIYLKTDNVFASMQFHLMHNAILLVLQLIIRG